MSAWTILTSNSTAQTGADAWTHLNNQSGDRVLNNGVVIIDKTESIAETMSVTSLSLKATIDSKSILLSQDDITQLSTVQGLIL